MKGGLTAIQQTLTPEASTVLTRSIAEATRRNHAQTTPLHVAATLLADPSGLLRHACLRSHPTTPNPLHTRALDLCFSVALDRLPTTTTTTDSTLSNALMAALKRAQAHQRRGCPEQQQPPLLAVKVELDQLIISILDDPSVSRVMREASFSSPAVKLTIEQSNTAPTRNLYINPRLDRGGQNHDEEVNRVLEILSRSKKQNPVLVGDSNLDAIMLEVLKKIKDTAHVISLANKFESLDRSKIPSAIVEFGYLLEKQNHARVVLDLGDLKWLGESIMAETGKAAVVEMSRILARFREAETGTCRLWIIGTATCATYLRCQVYHPSMEKDWDLQAVPIGHRSPVSGGHPRLGGSGILIRSVESLTPSRGFLLRSPQIEHVEISKKPSLCDECNKSYKVELAMLKPTTESPKVLPHWLQNTKEEEQILKQKAEKLMNKCRATCSRLHSNPSERSLDRKPRMPIYLNENQIETDLVLGPPKKAPESLPHEKNNAGFMDSDSPKKLLHGLIEKVSWQMEAAAAVAAAMTSRNEKWRGIVPKADSWLLFIGPDRIGKKKMASALSELMFGAAPVTIRLGGPTIDEDDGESDISLRGKTPIDKVAEALRRNPFSLILLEDVDNADALMLRALKQAMERGRLLDSYGREVRLGSVVFVLTADWLPENLKESQDALLHREEEEILKSAKFGTQLEISIEVISGKRKAEWAMKEDQPMKKAGGFGLSLDLNLAVGGDDDGEGSSDLTMENEHDYGRLLQVKNASPSVSSELIESVDETIMFKPVDFRPLRRRIWESINTKFMGIMGSGRVIKIDDEVVDRLVGGVWLGGAGSVFDEWAERVLVPGIQRLRRGEKVCDGAVIQLTASNGGERRRRSSRAVDWMPSRLTVCGV